MLDAESSMRKFTIFLKDEDATIAWGAALAKALQPGLAVYLHGDLGAGKTALARAVLQAAGHQGPVKSPTYTLVEPYQVAIAGQPTDFFHFDLYRLASPDEFLEAGFREYFIADNICFVEWPEKAAPALPVPDLDITLSVAGTGRQLECHALSDQGVQCLDQLHFVAKP